MLVKILESWIMDNMLYRGHQEEYLVSLVIYSFLFVYSNHYCVLDMIRRGNLRTRSIKLLVLDEADEMLAKGMHESCHLII